MGTPITGIVEAIVTKPSGFVDVKVNGRAYNHGKYAPRDVRQGDTISFEYDTVQRGQYTNYNIVPRSIRKAEGAVPSQQTSQNYTEAAKPAKREYGGYDARQDVISKQAAVNTALTFVQFAVSQGAIAPLPKTAKDAERLTLIRAWVLDEAKKFYELNTGNIWDMPEQAPAPSPGERRAGKGKVAETSAADTGSDEFPDDDIPF